MVLLTLRAFSLYFIIQVALANSEIPFFKVHRDSNKKNSNCITGMKFSDHRKYLKIFVNKFDPDIASFISSDVYEQFEQSFGNVVYITNDSCKRIQILNASLHFGNISINEAIPFEGG
ncbi:hypothetical protein MXB_1869, partial [Myxobolus squamalis]